MLYFWSENSSKSCDKKVTKYDSFDSSSRVECFCTSSGTNIWYKRQNSEKSKAAPIVFSVFTTVAQHQSQSESYKTREVLPDICKGPLNNLYYLFARQHNHEIYTLPHYMWKHILS